MKGYNSIGKVVAIYIKRAKGEPWAAIEKGLFKEGVGLLGDIHSGKGERQVTILSEEARKKLLSMGKAGLCISRFHENIRVESLNLKEIEIGTRISIGETIQEVTCMGKGCFAQCEILAEGKSCPLTTELLFTKVIKGGEIQLGD